MTWHHITWQDMTRQDKARPDQTRRNGMRWDTTTHHKARRDETKWNRNWLGLELGFGLEFRFGLGLGLGQGRGLGPVLGSDQGKSPYFPFWFGRYRKGIKPKPYFKRELKPQLEDVMDTLFSELFISVLLHFEPNSNLTTNPNPSSIPLNRFTVITRTIL